MKKRLSFLVSVIVFCLLVTAFGTVPALAGASDVTVDNNSFKEELSAAEWSNPESDVFARNGVLIFPETSTKYTRLITEKTVEVDEKSDELLHFEYDVRLVRIPSGGAFIFAFGLQSIESFSGEEGNVEIAVSKENGYKVAINAYETENEPTVLLKKQNAGIGDRFTLSAKVMKNGRMTVKFGNKTVYDGNIPVKGTGSVGFLQTGSCHVELSRVNIVSHRHDSPENVSFTENFDNSQYNANLLFSKMVYTSGYFPCGLDIQKVDGDPCLMFHNSGIAYASTMYQYSNFEMTFDVPYLNRVTTYDADGNIAVPRSMWFGITFGDDYIETNGTDYEFSPEFLYFQDTSTVIHGLADRICQPDPDYLFFDAKETRKFSVKLSVIDARVTVSMKWAGQKNWHELAAYTTATHETPLGYIHIWTCGPGNFAIDNLKIENKDEDPNLTEVDFKTNLLEIPEDFHYEPEPMVYRDKATASAEKFDWNWLICGFTRPKTTEGDGIVATGGETFNWYFVITLSAAVAVGMVIIGLVRFLIKRKPSAKEAPKNE